MATADYTQYDDIARYAFHSAIMQDVVPLDPSFKALPWLGIEGQGLKIPRIVYNAATQFLTVADAIDSGEDFSPAGGGHYRDAFTFTAQDFHLKSIATDRPLDDRILRELSDPHMQEQFITQAGIEAVLQRFNYLFINGSSSTSEFDGIEALCARLAFPSSGNVLFDLSCLVSLITAGDGIPTAFLMHRQAERLVLLHAQNGSGITTGTVPVQAMVHPVFGMRLHYCGIPILPNDHITLGAGPEYYTTIYAVQFGIGTGLAGIFPAKNGQMGVRIEKRHDDDCDTWYMKMKLECGLALYRESAIAKVEGVDTSDAVMPGY